MPTKLPPGPQPKSLLGSVLTSRDDAMNFALRSWKQYGDIVGTRFLLTQRATMLFHPDYVKHVLQDNAANYDNNISIIRGMKSLMGDGLFTQTTRAKWIIQRRMLQPIFSPKNLVHFDTFVVDEAVQYCQQLKEDQQVDIEEEMMTLVLKIIARTLFSLSIEPTETALLRSEARKLLPLLFDYINIPFPPLSVPTPRNRALKRSVASIDNIIYALIERYQANPPQEGREDLLSLLLAARDDEGMPLKPKQIRDELVTFLLGGHDTTAHSLAWCWYALDQHPEIASRFYEEIDEVLGTRNPTIADLSQMPYSFQFINEVLRLYGPSFALVRRAIKQDTIAGYDIPRNSLIILVPGVIHRHPDFWEEPEKFNPERFSRENEKRYRYAFLPFGGGAHLCIGKNLGMMIIQLILATIAQQYRFKLMPEAKVGMQFKLSLRSTSGIPMMVNDRHRDA